MERSAPFSSAAVFWCQQERKGCYAVGDWSRMGRPPVPRPEPSAFAAAAPSGPADQPVAGKEPTSIFASSGAILQADYFSGTGTAGKSKLLGTHCLSALQHVTFLSACHCAFCLPSLGLALLSVVLMIIAPLKTGCSGLVQPTCTRYTAQSCYVQCRPTPRNVAFQ